MVDTRTIRYHETPYFYDLEYDEGWDANDPSLEVEILNLQRKYKDPMYLASNASNRVVIIAEDKSGTIVGYALLYRYSLNEAILGLRWTPLGSPVRFGEILGVNVDESIRTRSNVLETLFAKAEALIKLNEVKISNTPEYEEAHRKYMANSEPAWCDGDCDIRGAHCADHPVQEQQYTVRDTAREVLLVVREGLASKLKRLRGKPNRSEVDLTAWHQDSELSWLSEEIPHEAISGVGGSGKTVRSISLSSHSKESDPHLRATGVSEGNVAGEFVGFVHALLARHADDKKDVKIKDASPHAAD